MQPGETCPCAPHTPQDQARPGGIDDVIGHTTNGSPPSHASHSGHHDDVIVGHECLEAKCVLCFVCRVRAFCQGSRDVPLLRMELGSIEPVFPLFSLVSGQYGAIIVSLTKHAPMSLPHCRIKRGLAYRRCDRAHDQRHSTTTRIAQWSSR